MFLPLSAQNALFHVCGSVELEGQQTFIRNAKGKAGEGAEALISGVSGQCSLVAYL